MCDNDAILTVSEENFRSINVTYETFVPLTGDPVPQAKVEPLVLEMGEGVFDKPGKQECALVNFTLTKVLLSDGKEEVPAKTWSKFLEFDSEKMTLTVKDYSGLDSEVYVNLQIMF